MTLAPECPQCPTVRARTGAGADTGTGQPWACPVHGSLSPLWRVTEPSYQAFAEHLALARPWPTWVRWPLPTGWQVTDFGCVVDPDGRSGSSPGPRAVFATCSGPDDADGVAEVTAVTEAPGVGLGARCARVRYVDPAPDVVLSAPAAVRVRVDGQSVALWTVPTSDLGSEPVPAGAAVEEPVLDRSVLVGVIDGRWLWLVFRPASAALMLHWTWVMEDAGALGPQLLEVPFEPLPRSW